MKDEQRQRLNLEQIIAAATEKAAERAAKRTVEELRKAGMLREPVNRYKRTEYILRSYGENRVTAEQAAAVEQALAQISAQRYAETIQLYYFAGKTNTEIADIIHTSEKTAARGRQRLVQKLSANIGKL